MKRTGDGTLAYVDLIETVVDLHERRLRVLHSLSDVVRGEVRAERLQTRLATVSVTKEHVASLMSDANWVVGGTTLCVWFPVCDVVCSVSFMH